MYTIEEALEKLNPRQKEAVAYGGGPLLIVAGAGTGKTTVITQRIAYLICIQKVNPEEILALTFTDKAAREMEERVDILVPYGFTGTWISTFHAFGDRVLRENALELGLPSNLQVLTRPEQIIFFRDHLFKFPLSRYRPLGNPTKFIEAMITLFSRAKDEDVSPQEYLTHASELQKHAKANPTDEVLAEEAARQMEIAGAYQTYQDLLAKAGKIDFGDQVTLALRLFRERATILNRYQQGFRYILVDEFQDTNYAQFQLVKLLAAHHQNIAVVGDDDQSIYKFRGAAISNILGFMDAYPEAKQIILTQNYRSPQVLLDTAYRLIAYNNPDRLEVKNDIDKHLVSQMTEGIPVQYLHYDSISSEADGVARLINEKVSKGERSWRDFAILVRTNDAADPFLRSLNMLSIPWQFTGTHGLYCRQEISLLISFLRVIANFDDSMSLYYLAASDIYKIPAKDITLATNFAARRNQTLFWVLSHLSTGIDLPNPFKGRVLSTGIDLPNPFTLKGRPSYSSLGNGLKGRVLSDIEELSEKISPAMQAVIAKITKDIETYAQFSVEHSTGEVLYKFITDSGYLSELTSSASSANEEKVKNIAKFFEIIRTTSSLLRYDRVAQFVDHLDMLIEAGDDPAEAEADKDLDAVNVFTVHKAKGLEFPVVIMVGLVEGRFPTHYRKEPIPLPDLLIKDILPSGNFHLQEERRLFYVGMTRAMRELYLTSAEDYGGKRIRKPSQFISEALNLSKADISPYKASDIEVIARHAPRAIHESLMAVPIPHHQLLNLSYFHIDDYYTCPLKYKYVHVLRVPIISHHTVIYGKALHDAVAEYYRRRLLGQKVSFDEIEPVFRSSWRSEGFLTRAHEEQRFQQGVETLRRFYETEVNKGTLPTYTEKEFSFILVNDRIVGRWDRVDVRDGETSIIDYKSSDIREQEKADERTRESLQLDIYALAYREIFGKIPDWTGLFFLDSGIMGVARKTEENLERIQQIIQEASRGIRARHFPAKPGYFTCTYCAYQRICPYRYKRR